MTSNPSRAYSVLKRMGAPPGQCEEDGGFTLLSHLEQNLSTQESADRIADYFASISQEFPPINVTSLPTHVQLLLETPTNQNEIPVIYQWDVYQAIMSAKKPRSGVPGDLPRKLVQEFPMELSGPVSAIFTSIVRKCEWPEMWKIEYGTPLQKEPCPKTEDQLRIISCTAFFSKVLEGLVIEWLYKYVKDKLDLGQYGGQKNNSISHYLIELTNFILYNQDMANPQAVLAVLVDFSKAFNRQNHNILITILAEMSVPAWLLKIVIAFLSNRVLQVKYKGKNTNKKSLPGGGPQGTKLGLFLFLILIQNGAGFQPNEVERNLGEIVTAGRTKRKPMQNTHQKFVDDLTLAVSIDLRTSLVQNENKIFPQSFHERRGYILPTDACEMQTQLNKLIDYTRTHQMKINNNKTKVILFNTSRKYDFLPQLTIGGEDFLEVVEEVKLLGVMLRSDMSWEANTNFICLKGYRRLWILRNLKKMHANDEQLLDMYIKQCRSILELAVPVWSAGLTKDQSNQIERVQKTALSIILGKERQMSYSDALEKFKLTTLAQRRVSLCDKFVKKSASSEKFNTWFQNAEHNPDNIQTRSLNNTYKTVYTRTKRYQVSALPYLTTRLNELSNH